MGYEFYLLKARYFFPLCKKSKASLDGMITPFDYPSIILRVHVIILRVQGIIEAQGVILRAAKDS